MARRVVYCDSSDLEKSINVIERMLTGQNINAAMASALNRTATHVRKLTKQHINEEYAIKRQKNRVHKSCSIERARDNKLTATVEFKDSPLPMHVFQYTLPRNKFRSPVHVTIKTSNGEKVVGMSNGSAIFGAYGGKKIIRRDLTQKNLATAYSVSVPQMVESEEVYDKLAKAAEEKLIERMNHEITWRLSKI